MKTPSYFESTALIPALAQVLRDDHGHKDLSGLHWTPSKRRAIAGMRRLYPEIAHWSDDAIGLAFRAFSKDFLGQPWADLLVGHRDEALLNYLCWRATRGAWTAGTDYALLAKAAEWRPGPVLPVLTQASAAT